MKMINLIGSQMFKISADDLPNKEPLRSVMVDILCCDPEACRDKEAYLELVKYSAKEIVKRFKK